MTNQQRRAVSEVLWCNDANDLRFAVETHGLELVKAAMVVDGFPPEVRAFLQPLLSELEECEQTSN